MLKPAVLQEKCARACRRIDACPRVSSSRTEGVPRSRPGVGSTEPLLRRGFVFQVSRRYGPQALRGNGARLRGAARTALPSSVTAANCIRLRVCVGGDALTFR